MNQTEWFNALKEKICYYSFVQDYGHFFKISGRNFCLDHNALEFLIKFQNLDLQMIPMMSYRTLEWKNDVLLDYYLYVYHYLNASIDTKIQCASYILSHADSLHSSESLYIIDEMYNLMERNHDWDIFDLLQRLIITHPFLFLPHHYDILGAFSLNVRDRQLLNVDINVFNDPQNIHNDNIHQSVLNAIDVLFEQYHSLVDQKLRNQVLKSCKDKCPEKVYKRISTDPLHN